MIGIIVANVGTLRGIYVAIRNGVEREISIRDAKRKGSH
jgi:hypothetical protein